MYSETEGCEVASIVTDGHLRVVQVLTPDGVMQDQMQGVPLRQIGVLPDDPHLEEEILAALGAEGRWAATLQVPTASGERARWSWQAAWVRADDSSPNLVLLTGRPANRQGAARGQPADFTQPTSGLAQLENVFLFVADEDGWVTFGNRAVQKHFELDAGELSSGRFPLPFFFCGASIDDVAAALAQVTSTGTELSLEARCDDRFYELCLSPERIDGGTAIVCVGYDVSEKVAFEARQKALEEQLRHSQKLEAIGRLAGGIAHEFNNLLTAIAGYAEIGMLHSSHEQVVATNLCGIRDTAQQAAHLTGQLLTFSRKEVVTPRLVQLNEGIARTEQMLDRLLGRGIELVHDFAADLPLLHIDPGHIDQVLLNLCINARDAMSGRGRLGIETRHVVCDAAAAERLGVQQGTHFVALRVWDTGSGIAPERVGLIFEPFFSTKAQGTGLGLSVVYGIVQLNGGHITVDSTVGEGTVFTVYFPPAAEQSVLPPASVVAEPTPGVETVLLVDDNQVVRELTAEILQNLGYDVLSAGGAEQAITAFEAFAGRIDLLLTDVSMPGADGRELYEMLLERQPRLPVLFMSGYSDNVLHSVGLDQGTAAFIRKPFSLKRLARSVREVLQSASREGQSPAGS